MVDLQGVSKSYGSTVALHPTDLAFANGQTTALIGPSGCGKSTLLRLIIGLIQPTSGQVIFDGQPVSENNLLEIRRRTGYVIQDGGLFPHLTAEDNVTLVAKQILHDDLTVEVRQALADRANDRNPLANDRLRNVMSGSPQPAIPGGPNIPIKSENPRSNSSINLRIDLSQVSKRVAELAEMVRIPKDLLSRYPTELSGGQRERISLMRALMLSPKVLLLDEPLAALDPMVRAALQTDLKRIFEELGTTVILVTHDMGEAAYLGQTIVLLREGKIVQIGKLEDFQKAPKEPFVTEFLNAQRSLVAL